MRYPRTLRFRLTAWYSAALALVLFVFGTLMYGIVDHRQTHHHQGMLLAKAAQVDRILGEHDDCRRLTREQTEDLDRLGQVVLVHEFKGTREIYYRSPRATVNPVPSPDDLGWQDGQGPVFTTTPYNGRTWTVLTLPYVARSGRRGLIRVMEDTEEHRETLRHIRFAMLLLFPLGIACSAAGGWWLSGRALAPVDRIARMAREIEASKLDQRLPHPGVADEIGRLVDTLNHMIARLQESFDAMRRFTADASHELRNPLATMQNTVDVVLSKPRTEAEQRAALESLGEDLGRLRKIVADLLLLARADDGRLTMAREPVALDRLLQSLAEVHLPEAQERGVTLDVAAPGPLVVDGDERWLFQLVGNLLENALRFTPPGGSIRMAALPAGAWIRLVVQDTGPGIPEADLERIFERFYQADPSRARTEKPGSGLGLAIADWIARSHGGRISAANAPGGGAVFTVELPART